MSTRHSNVFYALAFQIYLLLYAVRIRCLCAVSLISKTEISLSFSFFARPHVRKFQIILSHPNYKSRHRNFQGFIGHFLRSIKVVSESLNVLYKSTLVLNYVRAANRPYCIIRIVFKRT
ncbi:hypothetical protein L596_023741 [Steinernema carpocapsae]|uniref:Uncharacterized protein n=1 Tax=Steinernema carpocapsae TaxID=34508 RepID=A0A4U5MEM3_STECR|nr:hypothetical protein L596_023741 [Steinernema carpocapsae]